MSRCLSPQCVGDQEVAACTFTVCQHKPEPLLGHQLCSTSSPQKIYLQATTHAANKVEGLLSEIEWCWIHHFVIKSGPAYGRRFLLNFICQHAQFNLDEELLVGYKLMIND